MRSFAWALLLLSSVLLTSGREPERRVIQVTNAGELMELFATPLNDVVVQLAPGRYDIAPTTVQIPEWCSSARLDTLSHGVAVSGRNVRIVGPENGEAVIESKAEVKVHFRDCADCEIERVTVETEAQGAVSENTGAAILCHRSSLLVRSCLIICRSNAPGLIAFDDGIVGRQGAILDIQFNEIEGMSRGVTLLDDARAIITNNVIQGRAIVGALVGCNAEAVMERNLLRALAAGVQLTEKASLSFRANIVEEVYANGISGISAGEPGLGRVRIEKNVFFRCGSAAIAMRADGDQRATRNLIVEAGVGDRRIESVIVVWGGEPEAVIRKNTLYDNTVTDESLDRDVPREIFWRERRSWTRTYRNTPVGVGGRHRFHESAFLTRYGRWMD